MIFVDKRFLETPQVEETRVAEMGAGAVDDDLRGHCYRSPSSFPCSPVKTGNRNTTTTADSNTDGWWWVSGRCRHECEALHWTKERVW